MCTDSFSKWLYSPCVEPEPRLVGGRMGYAFHRFPIKGGVAPMTVMRKQIVENMTTNNALFRRLKAGQ